MKLKETKVNQGGLMRCCLLSLSEHVNENPDREVVGNEVIDCNYCSNGSMIHEEGVWRWNHD